MAYLEIPEGSVEVQTGLWASEHHYTVGGVYKMRYNIYSSEGYCFWEVNQPENYDREGNLKPEDQRVYATFCSTVCRKIDAINENFISVPYQEGYEVVSAGLEKVTS